MVNTIILIFICVPHIFIIASIPDNEKEEAWIKE